MDDKEYEKSLVKEIQDGQYAASLLESPEGAFLQDFVNDRVSQLVTKMTSTTPLSEAEYLDAHGGIKELKSVIVMLHTKTSRLPKAQEELHDLKESTR